MAGRQRQNETQREERITVDGHEVIVIRSARRTRTVSGDQVGGLLRLRVPARTSRRELDKHARAFRRRMASKGSAAAAGDGALAERASALSAKYLDGIPQPTSVTWSSQQLRRWGSTTSTTGTVRLSARLKHMPGWVVDAVLVHELAHLLEPDHGAAFKKLVDRYPRTAEADAFLAGVSWAEENLRT
ncbi:M48 metallopeptidase family protein [Nesterenkonia populi]|uniref:M48 metallopeptidase family protein n=1 Tax=Nesterenkonia populi TaxID=1591087 RepID=UPI0011BF0592|nr:M48 family metallopeptidase [Nesterenkonia populi]